MLAYCEASATLALIVKRSANGQDFALSEAGLLYIEAALNKGALKDGKQASPRGIRSAGGCRLEPSAAILPDGQLFERAGDAQ